MSVEFSVPLSQIAEALNLTEVYVAENYKETNISTVEINRPGLELTGYLEFFDNKRIQVLGNTEFSYLGRYGPEAQKMVIDSIFSFGPPAVIICRDIEPSNAILGASSLLRYCTSDAVRSDVLCGVLKIDTLCSFALSRIAFDGSISRQIRSGGSENGY